MLPFWPPIKMTVLVHGPLIHALEKSSLGLEVRANVEVLHAEGEPTPGAHQHSFVMLSEGVARGVESGAHVTAILRRPVLVEAESSIETANTIERSVEFPIGEHGAYAGLLTEVVAYAADCEMSSLAVRRIAVRNN